MMPCPEGQRFGRLVVIREAAKIVDGTTSRRAVLSRCDCGEQATVRLVSLRSGNTQSCGCLGKERRRAATATHGLSGHELYQTWWAIQDRCLNESTWEYRYYGGRGIGVCARWREVALFIADVESELGPRPAGMTLDRRDNDRGYEPGNIRWASRREQVINRHQPVFVPGLPGSAPSEFYRQLSMS